jgi:hypothetical protein
MLPAKHFMTSPVRQGDYIYDSSFNLAAVQFKDQFLLKLKNFRFSCLMIFPFFAQLI